MVVAGIDYSMTSPSICIHKGSDWGLENCTFYFRTDKVKLAKDFGQFKGHLIEPWVQYEERFLNSAEWAEKLLREHEPSRITLEGYAMGAKGMVFHIGENTGILKQKMWLLKIPFIVPAPSAVKKFATGKGNANKEKMEDAFVAETGFDVRSAIGQTSGFTPSSDIIDSYYMAKWSFYKYGTEVSK